MGLFSKFGSRGPEDKPHWLRSWVIPPGGHDNPDVEEMKRAAAADVAAMENEDRRDFRPDAPGHREDDL